MPFFNDEMPFFEKKFFLSKNAIFFYKLPKISGFEDFLFKKIMDFFLKYSKKNVVFF